MNYWEILDLIRYITSFEWIKDFLLLLISISTSILNIFLFPINVLIDMFLPDMSQYFEIVDQMFTYASTYIGWGISAIGLDPRIISIALAFLTFKLSISLATYAAKVFIKWKKALVW